MHKNRFIICPKCGERGFPTRRWVRNSYYPQLISMEIMVYEKFLIQLKNDPTDSYAQHMVNVRKPFIKGKRYRGRPTKHLISGKEENENFDKEQCYRIHTHRYYYFYVGHYDKELYKKQKKEYELKKRKSKPTGRTWCKLPKEYAIYHPSINKIFYKEKLENLDNYTKNKRDKRWMKSHIRYEKDS